MGGVFPVTRRSAPGWQWAGSGLAAADRMVRHCFYTGALARVYRRPVRVYQVGMVMPGPDPDDYPPIDPNEPVPDDPGPLSPDTPETLPPAPVEPMPGPDDPGNVPSGEPEPV